MSIHERVSTKTGTRTWEVRYRQGGSNRSRTFKTEQEARIFDGEVARESYHGTIDNLHAGEMPLDEFVEIWWTNEARPNLQENTLRGYANAYNNHIFPYLGHMQLKAISPRMVEEWRIALESNGVGGPTVRTSMIVLQSCLKRAVVYGEISRNPVADVRKPKRIRKKEVKPLTPLQIESILRELRDASRYRDATFVSVIAYAGLRPGEARGLEWQNVNDKTILVEQAAASGDVKSTKTEKNRTVKLHAALRHDLEWWRAFNGNPTEGYVFQSKSRPGKPWPEEAYKSWQQKGFQSALSGAGLPEGRPYDLRHSFASLLIHSGCSVVETARQLGHSPTMCLSTYAHVMDELEGDHRSIDELIAEARLEIHGNSVGERMPARREATSPKRAEKGSEEPIANKPANTKGGPRKLDVRKCSDETPSRAEMQKWLAP